MLQRNISNQLVLILLFGITAAVTFCIHWNLWHTFEFADEPLWQSRTSALVRDLSEGNPLNQNDYSGHPGMSFLLIAVLLNDIFSLPASELLDASVSLIIAITVGGIAVTAYSLYPKQFPWWLGVAGLIALHPLFVRTSPTSAITAPLILLMFLQISTMYKKHVSISSFLLLGIPLGVTLATRWFTALLFIAPLISLLVFRFKHTYLFLTGMIAVAIGWILNPLLWHQPTDHLLYSLNRLQLHVTTIHVDDVTAYDVLLYTPFALITFCITIWALIYKRNALLHPLSRFFVVDVIAISLGTSLLLYIAESHSIRYFFPLIFFWDCIGSLILINYLRSKLDHLNLRTQSIVVLVTVIFLVSAQIYLLMQRF